MGDVCIAVPWRGGCAHREAAWAWVHDKLATTFPTWPITTGAGPDIWTKGAALAEAIGVGDSEDILVIYDADVWCPDLAAAVKAVSDGHIWAVPHDLVLRLTEDATRDRLAGGNTDLLEQRPYQGHPGGGITVLRRSTWEHVPIDPRFVGWGQEDDAWATALYRLYGPPWRGSADLLHFFHPPQDRRDRRVGNETNWVLFRRYQRARGDDLEQLLHEARTALQEAP